MVKDLPPKPSERELAQAKWVKAEESNSGGCVEVAHVNDDWTVLRDSKDPDGPKQFYTAYEWECFLDGARKGEFDRQ